MNLSDAEEECENTDFATEECGICVCSPGGGGLGKRAEKVASNMICIPPMALGSSISLAFGRPGEEGGGQLGKDEVAYGTWTGQFCVLP